MKRSRSRKLKICSANTLLVAGVFAFSAGLSAQPDGDPSSMQGHAGKSEAGIMVDSSGFMATFVGGTTKSGGRLKVRIAGPDGKTVYDAVSESGILDWHLDANLPDGQYRWDAWFSSGPAMDQSAVKQGNGNNGGNVRPNYRGGVFEVQDGSLVMPEQFGAGEQASVSWPERAFGAALSFLIPEAAAQVSHNDGVNIVDAAEDNSTFLSVQNFDAGNNGLCNQGGDLLIFVDNSCAGGNSEMVIEAGSPDFSIFVESTGDIGLGTSTPAADLHIMGTDLRIESGFTGGDWNLNPGSNGLWFENNVSGAFPVKFENDAPTNSLVVKDDSGNIGLGTNSPDVPLHVERSDGSAQLLVRETSGTTGARELFKLSNNGGPFFIFENTDISQSYSFAMGATGHFLLSHQQTSGVQMRLTPSGNMTITGSLSEGSSRAIKDDITPLDGETVLAKLENLPVSEWSYTADQTKRHVGPMAEDFYATFGLGPDNKHITPRDLAGVALAAAKALRKENESLKSDNRELRARLERIESRLGLSEE